MLLASSNFFYSPLEQFVIAPFLQTPLSVFGLDIYYTNVLHTVIGMVLFYIIFFSLITDFSIKNWSNLFEGTASYRIIPSRAQVVLELAYLGVLDMLLKNVKSKHAKEFFPLVFFLFVFILSLNLFGLLPYTYSFTSHFAVALMLGFGTFIAINYMLIKLNGWQSIGIFLPDGTSLGLAFLLVPIEVISYFFRPISLSIRLFANIMAGHALLNIFAGFTFLLLSSANPLIAAFYIFPAFIVVPLFFLEFIISLIQTYVFCTLVCIYINNILNPRSH